MAEGVGGQDPVYPQVGAPIVGGGQAGLGPGQGDQQEEEGHPAGQDQEEKRRSTVKKKIIKAKTLAVKS